VLELLELLSEPELELAPPLDDPLLVEPPLAIVPAPLEPAEPLLVAPDEFPEPFELSEAEPVAVIAPPSPVAPRLETPPLHAKLARLPRLRCRAHFTKGEFFTGPVFTCLYVYARAVKKALKSANVRGCTLLLNNFRVCA